MNILSLALLGLNKSIFFSNYMESLVSGKKYSLK
jgi:hypothetical protein